VPLLEHKNEVHTHQRRCMEHTVSHLPVDEGEQEPAELVSVSLEVLLLQLENRCKWRANGDTETSGLELPNRSYQGIREVLFGYINRNGLRNNPQLKPCWVAVATRRLQRRWTRWRGRQNMAQQ
jgi:hypothetical protein